MLVLRKPIIKSTKINAETLETLLFISFSNKMITFFEYLIVLVFIIYFF